MAESNSPSSFQPPPVPPLPMAIDGADRDVALASSEILTRREVLERRLRGMKQLQGIYIEHFWALMEDLKHNQREYYRTYGKSPFKEDEKKAEGIGGDYPEGIGENGKIGLGLGSVTGSDEIRKCDVTGCKYAVGAASMFEACFKIYRSLLLPGSPTKRRKVFSKRFKKSRS